MARGKWTTSFNDRAKAQYQADQIGQVAGGGPSDAEFDVLNAILFELQQIRMLLASQQQQRPMPQQWPHQG